MCFSHIRDKCHGDIPIFRVGETSQGYLQNQADAQSAISSADVIGFLNDRLPPRVKSRACSRASENTISGLN